MNRVSSAMTNGDMQYHLRRQESRMNDVRNSIGTQQKSLNLRDDPIAAGHLVRYQSFLTRSDQFEKNSKTIYDQFAVADSAITQSVDVLQRVRELAVTAANGTYTADDLKLMSGEVDELLKEMVKTANEMTADGHYMFAGTRSNGAAFEVETGSVPGSAHPMITAVRYNGNIDTNQVEVGERTFLDIDRAGDRVFWAEHQRLFASRDASNFQVSADSLISVDGVDIALKAGDNVYAVAAKINDSGAPVRASIDPVTRGLNFETTDSHQLWLNDATGTVLNDLGIINDNSQRPPYNINPASRSSGGSVFDTVIALRDAMLAGDHEAIGGRVLGSLDLGLTNLSRRHADIGSQMERAMLTAKHNSVNSLNTTAQISREGDIDMAEAITDMKMLEYVQQATMSSAARLYTNSILNYMR